MNDNTAKMPEWERRLREAGVTPFWELVDDPLTEMLERASNVRIVGEDLDVDFGDAIQVPVSKK